MVAQPFRVQLKAALVEIARLGTELDRNRVELARAHRDTERLVPAADALLHETRAHSKECVCPMCRSVWGRREMIRERVAEYRAKGTGT